MKPQPIETAPKDGTWILVWEWGDVVPYVVRWEGAFDSAGWNIPDNHFRVWGDDDGEVVSTLLSRSVTHWAPLPDAPVWP